MQLRKLGYAALVAAGAAFAFGAVPMAKAEPLPGTCLLASGSAVCGAKGGMKFTYANSCYASKDGAKVVAQKACPPAKAAKRGGKKGGKKEMAKAKKPAKKKM